MKKVFNIGTIDSTSNGKNDNLATIVMELKTAKKECKVSVDLNLVSEYYTLSISGNIWNSKKTDIYSRGQNLVQIKELFPDDILVAKLHYLWKKYHLNDLKAGTRKQTEAIENHFEKMDYTKACDFLKSKGLYIDKGYVYSTSWLLDVIPNEIILDIEKMIASNNQ